MSRACAQGVACHKVGVRVQPEVGHLPHTCIAAWITLQTCACSNEMQVDCGGRYSKPQGQGHFGTTYVTRLSHIGGVACSGRRSA